MNPRAVLAHCWTGSPAAGWYPAASEALAACGIPVCAPALPEPDRPDLEDWLETLSAVIGDADERLLLIGHSLGAIALLHWLARAGRDTRVGGVLLIAPPIAPIGIAAVDAFLTPAPDLAAARRRVRRIEVLLSLADPYLKPEPLPLAHRLLTDLGATVHIVPDRGHFSPASGETPLPELLRWAASYLRTH